MKQYSSRRFSVLPVSCLVALTVNLLTGCGQSGPPRYEVTGRVTVDGIPVPNGTIGFLPDAQVNGPAAGGQITDGVYRIKASQGPTAGLHKVEIRGFRESGKPIATGIGGTTVGLSAIAETERIEVYVLAKYNSKMTLTYDVEFGKNEKNFELKSH